MDARTVVVGGISIHLLFSNMRYSQQKEVILNLIYSTKSHPTVNWIYNNARTQIPNISLGTVYRNLKQLEKDKLISLRGTLVPATTINKVIGTIPVLGKILVGSKTGEGVFGVSFKIKGPPKKLETTVNPIKTLTPRFITRTLEKIKKN